MAEQTCTNCDGTGRVKLPWHPYDPRRTASCGYCGGTGKVAAPQNQERRP